MSTYQVVRYIDGESVIHAGPFVCPITAQGILDCFFLDYQDFVVESGRDFFVYLVKDSWVLVRLEKLT